MQAGTESPREMPEALAKKRNTDRKFLEQLLDISKLDNYTVPVPIKADLRQYQQVSTVPGHLFTACMFTLAYLASLFIISVHIGVTEL